jgi:hypothetical protein
MVRLVLTSRAQLAAENVFLRKQLALYQERRTKPRRADEATRVALVLLSSSSTGAHYGITGKAKLFPGSVASLASYSRANTSNLTCSGRPSTSRPLAGES